MKFFVAIARILVGVLFIFSGLIKANDPLGLSYKMQEFFEVWNEGLRKSSFFLNHALINLFDFLHEHSLALSVIMIAFEIIAGFALLLGWQMKTFSRLLLLLIIFFTFLTAYAFLSGKFKNCGCFGDCIPISPKTSFLKDVALTILIFFLFWQRKNIKPLFSRSFNFLSMSVIIILSFGIQWYMLTYLPVIDCLPFKKGNNISEKMKMPTNAVQPITEITFEYQKGGKVVKFNSDNFPPDFNTSTYKFISRKEKMIREGKNNEPPIKGFSLITLNGDDSTEVILQRSGYSILYFTSPDENNEWRRRNNLETTFRIAVGEGIPVYAVTINGEGLKNQFEKVKWNFQIFKVDYTVFRIAARANPTIYLIKRGTIMEKWSLAKIDAALKYIQNLKP